MTSRGRDGSVKNYQNDTLPHSSATPLRTDAAILADEVSKVSDLIKWTRMTELTESEAMADHMSIAAYYGMAELMGPPGAEGTQLYKMQADENPKNVRLRSSSGRGGAEEGDRFHGDQKICYDSS